MQTGPTPTLSTSWSGIDVREHDRGCGSRVESCPEVVVYPSGTHQLSFRDPPVILQGLTGCPSETRQLSFRGPAVVLQGLTICVQGPVSCLSGTHHLSFRDRQLSFRDPLAVLQEPTSCPSGTRQWSFRDPPSCPSRSGHLSFDSCPSDTRQLSFRDPPVILQGLDSHPSGTHQRTPRTWEARGWKPTDHPQPLRE